MVRHKNIDKKFGERQELISKRQRRPLLSETDIHQMMYGLLKLFFSWTRAYHGGIKSGGPIIFLIMDSQLSNTMNLKVQRI